MKTIMHALAAALVCVLLASAASAQTRPVRATHFESKSCGHVQGRNGRTVYVCDTRSTRDPVYFWWFMDRQSGGSSSGSE